MKIKNIERLRKKTTQYPIYLPVASRNTSIKMTVNWVERINHKSDKALANTYNNDVDKFYENNADSSMRIKKSKVTKHDTPVYHITMQCEYFNNYWHYQVTLQFNSYFKCWVYTIYPPYVHMQRFICEFVPDITKLNSPETTLEFIAGIIAVMMRDYIDHKPKPLPLV